VKGRGALAFIKVEVSGIKNIIERVFRRGKVKKGPGGGQALMQPLLSLFAGKQ